MRRNYYREHAAQARVRAEAIREAVRPRLIPLTDCFRNSETADYTISPDGAHIALVRPRENRMNVHARKVADPAETRLTGARERDIAGYARANGH